MKTIKDLTKEQAIEIAKMIYNFDEGIKSDFEFHYQPYDSSHYEDAREFIWIIFDGIIFADKVYRIKLEIASNLDCYLFYLDKGSYQVLGSSNQYWVQKKFREWDITPTPLPGDMFSKFADSSLFPKK